MNLLEINANKLFEVLGSDPERGLSAEDVERNRREFSEVSPKKGILFVLKGLFGDVMPILFVVLSLITLKFNGDTGAWLSLGLLFLVYTSFKFFSLRYTAKITKAISDKQTRAKVIRDGRLSEVDISELVKGDIIVVGFGDVVPCDALIIKQSTLRVSEVQLTGNSSPVLKLTQEDVIRGKGVPYYECILFAGSVVMSGSARAVVCNTGREVFDKKNKLTTRSKHARRTRIFEIASFVSKNISLMWIVISLVMFITGVMRGQDAFDVLYLCTSLALSSFPDLILTLFDLTLSVGSKRLMKKGCVIRDMTAIDRMCDINCVVVDNSRYFRTSSPKPNTVYVNDTKKKFRGANDKEVREIFELALAASVSSERGMSYNGVSVEKSLLAAGEEIGLTQNKIYEKYLPLEKMPYDSAMQMSRVIYFKDSEFYTVALGSPWAVLKTCSYAAKDGERQILSEAEKRALRELAHSIADGNEGVVAVAVKRIEYKEGTGQITSDRGFTFKGYIGLHTSINAESARAVNLCSKSGIDVVLMSSEAKFTSLGFAKSLAIMKEGDREITAKEFLSRDDGLFRTDIKKYKVYISLESEDKANIVSWRKEEGDIIAAAVSGVEDLRLLLEADVSFSSADNADNAVKQNSDVIVNSGFEVIPECIKYARSIYRNTRHMLQYLVSFQFILLFVSLIPMLIKVTPLFSPSAVVFYSVLVSLPLAASLSVENLRGNELKDTFGKEIEGLNIHNLVIIPGISALVTAASVLLSERFSSAIAGGASGASFMTLVSSTVFLSFVMSAEDTFDVSIFKNKELIFASVFAVLVSLLFIYVPALSRLIGVERIGAMTLIFALLTGLIPSIVAVGIKLFKKYVFSQNSKNVKNFI